MATDLELYLLSQIAPLAVPVNQTPASTSTNGTPTPSAGTETMDSVLGVYQPNLTAGRRYLAIMNGLAVSGSVAADVFRFNLRISGSSSAPTSSSTVVASTQYVVPSAGGGGQQTIALGGSFIAPATGTNTLAMFTVRIAGTGIATPISIGVARELYVAYLGTV